MAYNFKSIADVEVVAEPTESANVLIEENGEIKKAPMGGIGGTGGASGFDIAVLTSRSGGSGGRIVRGSYDELLSKIDALEPILGLLVTYHDDICYYDVASSVGKKYDGISNMDAIMFYHGDYEWYLHPDNSVYINDIGD